MSQIVEEYYKQADILPFLLRQKMAKLRRNPDILHEFEFWIEHRQYKNDSCVTISGYTAKKLALMSEYLNGEGAFMLLIELREHPENALQIISRGFTMK